MNIDDVRDRRKLTDLIWEIAVDNALTSTTLAD
jgi:hypothetical protein